MPGDIQGPTVVLDADVSKVDAALSGLKDKFSSFGNDLTGIAKGFNLDGVADQIDKVSDKFKSIGSTLAISAAPFELYGALAVNAYSDFEKGIGKINTLLPEATKTEIAAIGEQLKGFSTEFGANIDDAIQAYYDALSAGVSQQDVMPFMETAQKAAVAGMSDVSVSVDGLTSILNSYQMETSKAKEVSDQMFKIVELGKIEFNELANNIGKVAPTAAQFKVGFGDLGAAIASITSQGLKPEQTMTVLTSLISQLGMSGTELSDKFKEITGQTFPEFIASGGTLAEAIGKIRDYAQQTNTPLMDMTGNLEAAKALAMLGGPAYEQYAEFLDKITKSAGATEKAYSKMSDTMAFAMDKLKSQMHNTMIEVGDALAPTVKEFTQWLSENSGKIKDFAVSIAQNAVPAIEKLFDILKGLMDSFNSLSPETKSMLASVFGVGIVGAAAGGPVLYGIGTIGSGVSGIVRTLGELSKYASGTGLSTISSEVGTLGAVSANSLPAISALLGPTGILAIGLGAGAIAAYSTNFANFRNNVNNILKDISHLAGSASTGEWENVGKNMASAVGHGFETVKDLIIKGLPEANDVLKGFNDGLETASSEIADGFAKNITTGLISAFENIQWPDMSQDMQEVYKSMLTKTAYEENMNAVIEDIKSAFSNIDLTEAGVSMMNTLFAGAGGVVPGLTATLKGLIEGGLKGSFETISNYFLDKFAEKFGLSPAEVQAMLKGQGPFGLGDTMAGWYGESYKQDTSNSQAIINRKIEKLINAGLTPTAARQQAETQYYQNIAAHQGGYLKPEDVTHATQTGTEAAAPAIANQTGASVAEQLAKDRGMYYKGQLDIAAAERLLEKAPQLADKYKQNTPAGTTSDPLVVTMQQPSSTSAQQSATSVSQPTPRVEVPSGNIPDLFTRDPARYVQQELKAILEGGFNDSVDAYVQWLKENKMTVEQRLKQMFLEGKAEGLGGSMDWEEWLPKAMKAFGTTGNEVKSTVPEINTLNTSLEKTGINGDKLSNVLNNLNTSLSDHYISLQESKDYLAEYNKAAEDNTKYTQEQVKQTKDLMSAIGMLGTAQNMYNQYMSDGRLDATESASVQQALAESTRLIGEAGITATSDISGLPGALQALASAAQAAMSQIQAAISQAQSAASAAASGWKMQTSPTKYPTMAPSSPINFNINMSNNTFPTGTKPSDVMRDINGMLRITA